MARETKEEIKKSIVTYLAGKIGSGYEPSDLTVEGIRTGLHNNYDEEYLQGLVDELEKEGTIVRRDMRFTVYVSADDVDKISKYKQFGISTKTELFGAIILIIMAVGISIMMNRVFGYPLFDGSIYVGIMFSSIFAYPLGMTFLNVYNAITHRISILSRTEKDALTVLILLNILVSVFVFGYTYLSSKELPTTTAVLEGFAVASGLWLGWWGVKNYVLERHAQK